ncbi:HET-domain-containing protein [Annulohypoxylon truncatum]|uniref:HET-domain-containing protein n=1 Tax=Annulohypoxylon truncatum TaxID=327061 RepID=UPI002008AD4D|nr:HET-domain-containing protein [Annulohypoxylon truncatum]KAI1211173.1 HET-domain-containing protein [Annulohypoxylon truncatum]
MLCDVCRTGLEGVWDPKNTRRIGLLEDFPDLLEKLFPEVEDENYDEVLDEHERELREPERYVFGHHTDYNSMLRSKLLGCVVCSEFSDLNDEDDLNPSFANLGYYSAFQILLPRGEASQATMAVYVGEPLEQIPHDMVAHDENDDVNSEISHSTSDLQTWAHIQTWMDRCLANHELCLHQDSEIFWPTRLLELRQTGDEKFFRLVYREELDSTERYVTLSHCWGPGPPETKLRLLKSTIDGLRNGLSVDILPKTFQNAFEVIARLKVRYIWIDRLCIVQDSAEDWRAEASTMQSVYRHGLLNIAALSAPDDQAGCFFDRDPASVAPTIVDLGPRDGSIGMFYRFEAEREAWMKDFEGQPLLSRAWVLQERILSTRNLYFGSKQVFWECFETNCCETVPNTSLDKPSNYPSYSRLHRTESSTYKWKPLIHPKKGRSIAQPTDWDSVILTYSQCNLTFPCDKLVAISGLAKRMGYIMRTEYGDGYDTYLAGLWEHTMPESLLWVPKIIGSRISSYRAPSWSWASLDGDIDFRSVRRQSRWRVELLRAEMVPHGNDVTGEVVSGTLTLRGHICKARRSKRVRETRNERREIYSIGSFHHPESDAPVDFHHPENDMPVDLDLRTRYLQFDTIDDSCETVILLFFTCEPHKAKVFSYVQVQGLALIPDDQSQSYRRVGSVWLKEPTDLEGDFERELFSRFPTKTVSVV